ncbi:MAG: hypothetical protein H6739_29485 [Alphaproteobacteria bacterium]|nr:hypothetical protein [Alphaproteobacteria bacterium]
MLWWTLLACVGSKSSSDTGEAPGQILGPDLVVMDDEDHGLIVTVTGGAASSWQFGASRVGFEYGDFDWEREGCLNGDDVCHTLEDGYNLIEWLGEYCDPPQDGATCMPRVFYRTSELTYVIKPTRGLGCWTWGADTGPYRSAGCEVVSWSGSSCASC